MKKIKYDIKELVSTEVKARDKKYWQHAFIIYAAIEIIIITTQYFITKNHCKVCVSPPGYYPLNWLQHLLFTAVLWFCLKQFYGLQRWKIIVLNILLFTGYYFLWIAARYAIFHSGNSWLVWPQIPAKPFRAFVYNSWTDIASYVLKLSAFYALKFYLEYRKAQKQRIELAVINKSMQLNMLKQQLSPHFYFNTLNNLYGLAMADSKKLSNALEQLANIMGYVLKDCNEPKVLLIQEIKFLESYIALEKLRYEHATVIEMSVEGEANGQTILPLLLIQFVENAFKHGMKEKSDSNWMKVKLLVYENELLFRVHNSSSKAGTEKGIGINSVKRILHLQYEGKYELEMQNENNHFSVNLKLNLS
ncbi:MAG: sensor histidine kinase [Gloeobacteraceae cyanobacterium ES-bin-316]|nr:sensor histidine kinase [Ferruginibacter sp.]